MSTVIVLADESNISNAPDDVDARCLVNPPNNTVLQAGNELLVVRERPLAGTS